MAAFLALCLCALGSFLAFKLTQRGDPAAPTRNSEVSEDRSERAAERAVSTTQEPRDESPPPPPKRAKEKARAPRRTTSEEGSAAAAPAQLRIHGIVTDPETAALENVVVRWIPASASELERRRNDGAITGATEDRSGLPPNLRRALDKSVSATTDAMGHFELYVPVDPMERGSVVLASTTGFTTEIERLGDTAPSDRGSENQDRLAAVEYDVTSADDEGAGGGETAETAGDEPAGNETREGGVSALELTFQLKPASSISGSVIGAGGGEAAQGVPVHAITIDPDKPAMLAKLSADAPMGWVREDGSYLLQGLPPGDYHVLPKPDGSTYAPTVTAKRIALEAATDVTDVDFELRRGGTLAGRVEGPDGEPLAGVRCSVQPTDLATSTLSGDVERIQFFGGKTTTSDGDGSFEFGGLPLEASYRVAAHLKEWAPSSSQPVKLTESEPVGEVTISLIRGHSVSGRVTFADGAPAVGIEVRAMPNLSDFMGAQGSGEATSESDETGAFKIDHIAPGTVWLTAGKLRPEDFFDSERRLEVKVVDADVSGVRLTIPSKTTEHVKLSGIVVDDLGAPVEKARVGLQKSGAIPGMLSSESAESTADGRFEITVDDPTSAFKLRATKSGYSASELNGATAGTEIRLQLVRHGTIRGRVVSAQGDPPPLGGRVTVLPEDGSSEIESFLQLAQGNASEGGVALATDGTFSVPAPAGRVVVRASVPGFAPGESGAVRVVPGEESSTVDVVVTAGAIVSGTVRLRGGDPISGAAVRVSLDTDKSSASLAKMMPEIFGKLNDVATTGDDGTFLMKHLPPGDYVVTADHEDYAPSASVRIKLAQDQELEVRPLTLTRGASIGGRIVEDDKPLGGMLVQLMGDGPILRAMAGADGGFRFDKLRTGNYILTVMDLAGMQKGRMRLKSLPITLADEEATELEVTYGTGVKVSGTVEGVPLTGMQLVTLRRPGGPLPEELDPLDSKSTFEATRYQVGTGLVKPDGTYEIEDVPPGQYILEVPAMPDDPSNFAAYKDLDRTPRVRKTIDVKEKDVKLDVKASRARKSR